MSLVKVHMASGSDSHVEKSHLFISEPIGLKPASEIAGIGPVSAEKLRKHGYDKAYTILGQFLVLKMQEDLFVWWLEDICGASHYCARQAYQCLADWCNMFL